MKLLGTKLLNMQKKVRKPVKIQLILQETIKILKIMSLTKHSRVLKIQNCGYHNGEFPP